LLLLEKESESRYTEFCHEYRKWGLQDRTISSLLLWLYHSKPWSMDFETTVSLLSSSISDCLVEALMLTDRLGLYRSMYLY
jgi:hypothetical protein